MILYRFAHRKYAGDLSGQGAYLFGGRWNPPGTPALYASSSISLALLEVLVNAHTLSQLQQLQLVELRIDKIQPMVIGTDRLPANWRQDIEYTQLIGKEIFTAKQELFCKCPSAVIQQEWNFVLNPLHPAATSIRLNTVTDFYFDPRLFKTALTT
jgi:RES domain-containing protein